MTTNNIDFTNWTKATSTLSWGEQRVFHEALTLVAEGKIHMTYGANYKEGVPCLVNSVAQMMSHSQVSPGSMFPAVVQAFDTFNGLFKVRGINEPYKVSPLAAEILLHHFAPLKEKPAPVVDKAATENTVNDEEAPYIEPTDEELRVSLETGFNTDPPVGTLDAVVEDSVLMDATEMFADVESALRDS
jgi:hypothetical protein